MQTVEQVIINALVGAVVAYLFYRMKRMEDNVDKALDEAKARQLIEDKLEPIRVTEEDTAEDIKRLEAKIDMLIRLQMESK